MLITFASVSTPFERTDASFCITGVRKVSDTLFVGAPESGPYFVMERIDGGVADYKDRIKFWREFARNEVKYVSFGFKEGMGEYEKRYKDRQDTLPKGFPKVHKEGKYFNLRGGISSFERVIESALGETGDEGDAFFPKVHPSPVRLPNIWVCYASRRPILSASDVTIDDIEMVVTVIDWPEAPFVKHYGISKSFHYLMNHDSSRKEAYPLHPNNLSMNLHSFAAKVMLLINPAKLYMITPPLSTMAQIMKDSLKDHVYVGDSLEHAKKIYRERHNISEEEDLSPAQEREIDRISETLSLDKTAPPIRKTQTPQTLAVLDPSRKDVLFSWDQTSESIQVGEEKLLGNATQRYRLFGVGMGVNPIATVELPALSCYLHLK